MSSFVILMSTYQGERFVVEQLHSILAQLPEEGVIFVRDDGSTDATVARIESIGDPRIEITRGSNLGFAASFFALIASAPDDAKAYFLADQDDVWLPAKMKRATRWLDDVPTDVPALYCSRLQLVDADLRPIGLSPAGPKQPSFESALTENIVVGCTAAFNQAAKSLILRYGDLSKIYFHDWWIYLVVAAFGSVRFDPTPAVLYRQHGSNVLGMGAGIARYWTMARFVARRNYLDIMFDQINNFLLVNKERLSREQREFIERYFEPGSTKAALRLMLSPKRRKRRLVDDLLLRGMLLGALLSRRQLRRVSKMADGN